MQVVCVQAFGSHLPGDDVEMPDGAAWSEVYYAEPFSAAALRAKADAAIAALAAINAAESPAEPPADEAPAPEPPEPPEPAEAVTEAPDQERADG